VKIRFDHLGDFLADLVATANTEVILAAPFMTLVAARDLLARIPKGVSVTLVTRWDPLELASGVSDCRVYQEVALLENSRMLLVHNLHAKFYRSDSRAVVGSANITQKALRGASGRNLEALVELPSLSANWESFELELLRHAIVVDDLLFNRALGMQLALREDANRLEVIDDSARFEELDSRHQRIWIPSLPASDELFDIYMEGRFDTNHEVWRLLVEDFDAPVFLSRELLKNTLARQTLEKPGVPEILEFLSERERRFGEVRDYLERQGIQKEYSSTSWRLLMDWFLYFFPAAFSHRRNPHSELVQYIGD
jgi:hypothetical protein